MLLICIILSCSYLASVVWFDWTDEDRDLEKPPLFWWFNLVCITNTLWVSLLNYLFLWFAYWDATRRIWLMKQVTDSFELEFDTKDATAIRMPTINFMDL